MQDGGEICGGGAEFATFHLTTNKVLGTEVFRGRRTKKILQFLKKNPLLSKFNFKGGRGRRDGKEVVAEGWG